MALVCSKITYYLKTKVLKPVTQFVTKVEKACKKLPWWNPAKYLCVFVTTVIKVVVWVLREILVPIIGVICNVVTASRPSVRLHRIAGSSTPGKNDYIHAYYCPDGSTKYKTITASDEGEAEEKAIKEYANVC